MRMLAGILAGQPFRSVMMGDASLSARPMKRVADPLSQMGAVVKLREGRFPPLEIEGGALKPIRYEMPVASAQVKSAVLLAGLFAEGETEVIESNGHETTRRLHSSKWAPTLAATSDPLRCAAGRDSKAKSSMCRAISPRPLSSLWQAW